MRQELSRVLPPGQVCGAAAGEVWPPLGAGHQAVEARSARGPREGSGPEDPHVPEGLEAGPGQALDQGRPETPSGVDRATVDGDEHRVRQKDRKADGERRKARVLLGGLVDGGLEDDVHQQECGDKLRDEGSSLGPPFGDAVHAEASGEILLGGVGQLQDGGACHGAQDLRQDVAGSLLHGHLPVQHQAKCHGTIDLGAAVVADSVGQHSDSQSKGQRNLEHPARLLRDAHCAAATDEDKEGHSHEFRHALLGVDPGAAARRAVDEVHAVDQLLRRLVLLKGPALKEGV
mmetsp:Transcript_35736/g.97006  ORF Transcript_35736/g.97006 Transcript_35736/m.97006 type:complete len:289 (+) Transcript_35736:81-947(+)